MRDGTEGKAFNAKGEGMLGIGIDIGSTAMKIAVLDESGAVVDVGGHVPKETATTRERKSFSSSSPAEEDTTAESALAAPQALFTWL